MDNKITHKIKSKLNISNAIKNTAAVLFVFVFLLCMLAAAQKDLKLKMGHRGSDNVNGFYELPKDCCDVVFVGASTMFCTIDPLELYRNYGIRSYDFGSSAQPFILSRLFVEEAIKHQHPKVIALEMLRSTAEYERKDGSNLNYGLTDMPFSYDKLRAVSEMYPGDPAKMIFQLFPIFQYKDRWEELGREDFAATGKNYTMGAYTPNLISDHELDFSSYYEEESFSIPDENRKIFDDIYNMCRAEGIELLLFKSPNVGWNIGETKAVKELAEDYGLEFIDYYALLDELGIDCAVDFRDNTHLNRTGSPKTSAYMGEFLTEHYLLDDHRGMADAAVWEENLESLAHDRQNEKLSGCSTLPEYLSLLSYEGKTVIFSFSGELYPMEDFVRGFADGFGIDGSELLENGGAVVLKNGLLYGEAVFPGNKDRSLDLGFDSVLLTGYAISLNREVISLVDDGLTVLVYDDEWGQLVDIAAFDSYYPETALRLEAAAE